ncbi:MAG: Glu/Leu/Phe/Val dehydrogenase [Candidatus Undinarchaeales archaeon]|jgi:glutamate dehydrogenase (NAD(P)+)|nr:Glu/Leu/Phe/Val dehydrogenase [Candidatus Undinarchaeales archaeon]MDP7492219.1 Glu/Leu/Phe/Val dehydrogenase [Candidatus Undinarchaeales archaeon]
MGHDYFKEVVKDIKRAAKIIGLPIDHVARLAHPRAEIRVAVPLVRDNGSIEVFTGYRVQHHNARGPFKGGIRLDPDVKPDMLKAIAAIMSLKCATMDIPWGGSHGAISCDPDKLSRGELERVARRYTYMLLPFIGPKKDIPAPDRGTDAQFMSWIMDTFSTMHGHTITGVVTGKPVEVGGTRGRKDATGRGVMFITRRALEDANIPLQGSTVTCIGFGNVGSFAAHHLARKGCKVLAASDRHGGIHDPSGLDIHALREWVEEKGTVKGFPGAEPVTDDDILAMDIDVLVSAARELTVTSKNQAKVNARIIVEAANASVTSKAASALHERGIIVLPDILVSAGGVTASYFEWVQDTSSFFWSEHEIAVRLRDLMLQAYDDVNAIARERDLDLRTAAYVLSVGRLVEAQMRRGVWP